MLSKQELDTENILKKIKSKRFEINPRLKVESLDEFEKLSRRSKNIIKNGELDSLKKLIQYYSEKRNFKDLPNCGEKLNFELIKLSESILQKSNDINNILFNLSDDYLDFIHEIKTTFGINALSNKTLHKQFSNSNIEIFSLIKFLATNYFSKRDYAIYFLLNKFSEGPERITLEKIGYLMRITRERVRQIKIHKIQKFNENIIQLINANSPYRLFYKKYFKTNADIVVIDDAFARNINKTENCDFSKEYIDFILGQVYNDKYFNISLKYNSPLKSEYLIRKDLETAIDWKESFKKITQLIKAQNTTYVDFERVVRQYKKE